MIYNKAESPTLKHISFNTVFSWCQDFFARLMLPQEEEKVIVVHIFDNDIVWRLKAEGDFSDKCLT